MMPLGGLLRSERLKVADLRAEVAWLKEQQEDLRAEVAELGRQLRALQEREAVLNAQVLHLRRYTTLEVPAQNANGGHQEAATGRPGAVGCLEASGEAKGVLPT